MKNTLPKVKRLLKALRKGLFIAALVIIVGESVVVFYHRPSHRSSGTVTNHSATYRTVSDNTPSQWLSQSVLTPNIRKAFGNEKLTDDGHGSFYVNQDHSTLSQPTSATPAYLESGTDLGHGQISASVAVLTHSMSGARNTKVTKWKPAGYLQLSLGHDNYLWNKGHSIGDVLTAGWSDTSAHSGMASQKVTVAGLWDASESNAYNVTTQTQWANQADSAGTYGSVGYGQLYFEKLVLKEENLVDVKIAYSVTPLYDGTNVVPSGNWIQARSSDGKVNINAFVPNVMPGVAINYATGVGTIKK